MLKYSYAQLPVCIVHYKAQTLVGDLVSRTSSGNKIIQIFRSGESLCEGCVFSLAHVSCFASDVVGLIGKF